MQGALLPTDDQSALWLERMLRRQPAKYGHTCLCLLVHSWGCFGYIIQAQPGPRFQPTSNNFPRDQVVNALELESPDLLDAALMGRTRCFSAVPRLPQLPAKLCRTPDQIDNLAEPLLAWSAAAFPLQRSLCSPGAMGAGSGGLLCNRLSSRDCRETRQSLRTVASQATLPDIFGGRTKRS